MSDVERPKYVVISSSGNIEVRQYSPMIIAEVAVEGSRKEAINTGFRMLADYISGNNTIQQEIVMTAPVQQQSSENIAMTAPVQQQERDGVWKVSFIMPSQYNIDNLPTPKNENVTLKNISAKQFAVVTFSGLHSNDNLRKHEIRLLEYAKAKNLSVTSSPKYAFYNLPPLGHYLLCVATRL
ncbi:MAG: SOUL family heme-binding protein [Chlamydiota bacterium]